MLGSVVPVAGEDNEIIDQIGRGMSMGDELSPRRIASMRDGVAHDRDNAVRARRRGGSAWAPLVGMPLPATGEVIPLLLVGRKV